MDYKKVIPTIKYLGEAIQQKMNQGGEEDGQKQREE